jgi:endonuclease YncB( thermonuclease family)
MTRNNIVAALALAASAFSLNTQAADVNAKLYGTPAPAAAAQRAIEINPGTKYVQVSSGETVTFLIDGQQFTWTFRLYRQEGALALSAILPDALQAGDVMVYVATDPIYR